MDCIKQSEGERLHIIIRLLTGKSIEVGNVTPANTVLDLKETITDAEGIPVDQQRMVYNGKQLEDGRRHSSVRLSQVSVADPIGCADYILGNYALEEVTTPHIILSTLSFADIQFLVFKHPLDPSTPRRWRRQADLETRDSPRRPHQANDPQRRPPAIHLGPFPRHLLQRANPQLGTLLAGHRLRTAGDARVGQNVR